MENQPSKTKFALSVALKAAVVAFAGVGLGLSVFGQDGFMTADPFLYFTNLSNLWIAVVALAFLALEIVGRIRHRNLIRNWMLIVKYVFTVSVALTFLVFACLLAPTLGADYLNSPSNLCLHFFAPLFAIVDFVLVDARVGRGRGVFLWATVPPFAYFLATIAMSLNGVRYHNGEIVPYYFLNYEKLGWLRISQSGLGVAYWVLLMIVLVSGMGMLLLWLNNRAWFAEKPKA